MKTAQQEVQLHSTRIDLSERSRREAIQLLNQTLATALDLQTQIKQAHWNVKGSDFIQLHELFDELASEVLEHVDLVAERATSLGGQAYGTARVAAQQSLLPEYPLDTTAGAKHLVALSDRYAIYAKHLREAITKTADLGDQSTSDVYTELSRAADKRLWFLEAHLQT